MAGPVLSYDWKSHPRKQLRLPDYDYSLPGSYFVTICTASRHRIFDKRQFQQTALNVWRNIGRVYDHVHPDAFVVMPDHVHGVVVLREPESKIETRVGEGVSPSSKASPEHPLTPSPTQGPGSHSKRPGLFEVMRYFKNTTARRINAQRGTQGVSVWQRRYFESIIRSGRSLDARRNYIYSNPAYLTNGLPTEQELWECFQRDRLVFAE